VEKKQGVVAATAFLPPLEREREAQTPRVYDHAVLSDLLARFVGHHHRLTRALDFKTRAERERRLRFIKKKTFRRREKKVQKKKNIIIKNTHNKRKY
jgi:hypothetical protein